jgi:Ca2+-binding EF-hand superfamily protein
VITIEELKTLISRVGGDMSEVEAKALIGQADKDQNKGIDFSEFAKLWEALHGEGEVAQYFTWNHALYFHLQAAIRKEFSKLDSDNSGFITKGIFSK